MGFAPLHLGNYPAELLPATRRSGRLPRHLASPRPWVARRRSSPPMGRMPQSDFGGVYAALPERGQFDTIGFALLAGSRVVSLAVGVRA